MKVKVIEQHDGEGMFPTFSKGTKVTVTGEETKGFKHWFPCEIEGYQTYIPESFISEGVLVRDYNPTELIQNVGDILDVQEIANAWIVATNKRGEIGWIPAESVISIV
ncbi:MAG: hypothetical protein FWG63_06075 [Defluviitaleaceae bacterium]|nr:hypothetical protein [Defluviitaleaceae bacterium]